MDNRLVRSMVSVGERLPGRLGMAMDTITIGAAKRTGSNEVVHRYGSETFRYRYADRRTLRKVKHAIHDGTISHERVPLEVFGGLGQRGHDAIIDVGAHIGIYSVVLGVLNTDVPVYCFEPNDYNRAVLRENLAVNGLVEPRVQARSELVAGESGPVEFHEDVGRRGAVNHTAVPVSKHSAHVPVEKAAVRLSEFCADRGVKRPWLKIDAEGLELDILADVLDSGLDRPAGFVELHLNREDVSRNALFEMADDHGCALTELKKRYASTNPGFLFEPGERPVIELPDGCGCIEFAEWLSDQRDEG